MRFVAALLLVITTTGWIMVAGQAGLFVVPGLVSAEYTLGAGIAFTIIYVIAPVVLAIGWSLLVQRRLPTAKQAEMAVIVVVALLGLVVLALPVGLGLNWLVENTAL